MGSTTHWLVDDHDRVVIVNNGKTFNRCQGYRLANRGVGHKDFDDLTCKDSIRFLHGQPTTGDVPRLQKAGDSRPGKAENTSEGAHRSA